MRKIIARHTLLWALVILIISICGLSMGPFLKSFRSGFTSDAENIPYPGITIKSLRSHEFQKYTENLIEKKIRLRHSFIKVNSQLYYSLFKKSFAENSKVIIGKNNQLFQMDYIQDYCFQEKNVEKLTAWANNIKKMNDDVLSKGKVFIYIITPSKAEYIPAAIPDRFHCSTQGVKNSVHIMDQLLTERHVLHINGPDLMVKAMQKHPTPVFTPGGIHWNWLGSSIEAAAIIDALNRNSNLSMPKLEFSYTLGKVDPDGTDDDLLSIVKCWKPKADYQVPYIDFLNSPYQGKAITLSVIGGSFNESLIKLFLRYKLFSTIHFYRYFNTNMSYDLASGYRTTTSVIDIPTILKSDVIILEENSSLLVSDHGKRFYNQLMAG